MAAVKALTLMASIENEQAIRDWVASVGKAAEEVQAAIDDLSNRLSEAPHISIQLTQDDGGK